MYSLDNTPKSAKDLRQAAIEAHHANDLGKASELYCIYLAKSPKDAAVWSNLGALFRKQKKYDLAALAQKRALALHPEKPAVLNNAANAFFDAGNPEQSLALRKKAIKAEPDNQEHYTGLAKCYVSLHKLDMAEDILHQGIKKFPDFAELYIQLAFVQLAKGDYINGFKTFDWRWKGDELSLPDFPFPQWQGEPLHKKTILIIPEQGFGDTVLMARFLPQLKMLGPKIKMIVKPPLRRLFTHLQEYVEFVEQKDDAKFSDYWAPMMDLPRYLKTELKNLPAPLRLFIPQASINRAKMIFAPYQGYFKLGVMWSGSITFRSNHKRSFHHKRFLDFCDIPGVQLFSLYKGPLHKEFQKDGTPIFILDAAGTDQDFADTAAIMKELDLIVSVDSAVVHIAASLGLEVWNLLHYDPYWLYVPFKTHTPWYPTMRLIRQKNHNDWDTLFRTLKKDISKRVEQWKSK